MGKLDGRVAIVTGASRGIGAAVAARFAADGAAVAVTARTPEEGDHPLAGSVGSTVRQIQEAGHAALAVLADLARAEDRVRLVETVQRELGPVDVLVNNAAITYFEPVTEFDEGHYRAMFEVQVRAGFHLAQLVLPGMQERRQGWILNISSGVSRHPTGPPYPAFLGGGTVYGMCKAAIERFTTGLAAEVYAHGVAVNCLSPSGLVLTPGVLHHKLDQRTPPERHEKVELMVEASYALCTGDPAELTGRLTYSRPLLEELGVAIP